MAGTTPNLGLYLPGGGSTGTWTPDEVADIDPLNQNFVKLDQFAGTVGVQTNRNQQFYGPASAISSVNGMKLGDEYQESDGNKVLWRYDGTNWLTNIGGLYLIRPSSVVNGVVEADGSVSVNPSASTLSLNGIFTSRFRNYRILADITFSADSGLTTRMRTGGVDDVGATSYLWSLIGSNGAAVAVGESAGSGFQMGTSNQTFKSYVMDFFAPALAYSRTMLHWREVAVPNGGGSARQVNGGGMHTDVEVVDGVSFISAPSTFSVSNVRVYGYA